MSDDTIQYDVIIVGAGPAGLSCAIHLKQLHPDKSVCLIEKGKAVGSHLLSGAILEPSSLNQLLPDWEKTFSPNATDVTDESFYFLSEKKQYRVPSWLLPNMLHNTGNKIISLGILCQDLASVATELGVDIFTGTTAAHCVFKHNRVVGIHTGDLGLNAQGQPSSQHSPGFTIESPFTLLAEGARGFLTEQIINHYQLRAPNQYQTYGLGIKELWECPNEHHQTGSMMHCAGWPLPSKTYGGGFIYHYPNQRIGIGLITALDYSDPYLNPFQRLQQFKAHPKIAPLFDQARCLCYGARVVNEGGYTSLPQLHFPGGALLGCAAGFLNIAQIKGVHNAITSGQLAAQAIVNANTPGDLSGYTSLVQQSPMMKALYQARNMRQYFRYGLPLGTLLTGLDLKIAKGRVPWTLSARQPDRTHLYKTSSPFRTPDQPAPQIKHWKAPQDALLYANLYSRENQPNHLIIGDLNHFVHENQLYAHPETRYCPAQVYEYPDIKQPKRLHINASNCLHCKACDIKDPSNQIQWTLPEGGSGPNYMEM